MLEKKKQTLFVSHMFIAPENISNEWRRRQWKTC